jgi:exopolyphosphatase/pppGpp-phosphohydrolase
MSKAESPTLPHVIPTYNLIMDEIEDYLANEDEVRPEACRAAMTAALVKICEYYKKQEHRAYAIATSK